VRSSGRAAVRLHLLHRAAEGEASGLSVSEELGRHGYRISPGTLYPLLHGLEAEGLLASAERTENSGILLYYAAATEAGRATLATPAGRWPNSPPICCPHRSRPPPPHRERGEPDDQATGTGTAASSNPCTERPRLPEQGTGQHPTSQREIESSGPREVAFLAGRVRRAVRWPCQLEVAPPGRLDLAPPGLLEGLSPRPRPPWRWAGRGCPQGCRLGDGGRRLVGRRGRRSAGCFLEQVVRSGLGR